MIGSRNSSLLWEAKEAYRRYIVEGVVLGRRPELVGGSGSVGEWFAVNCSGASPAEFAELINAIRDDAGLKSQLMSGFWAAEHS
jgi:hypothetical protein